MGYVLTCVSKEATATTPAHDHIGDNAQTGGKQAADTEEWHVVYMYQLYISLFSFFFLLSVHIDTNVKVIQI